MLLQHALNHRGGHSLIPRARFDDLNLRGVRVLTQQLGALHMNTLCAEACCYSLVALLLLSDRPECHFLTAPSATSQRTARFGSKRYWRASCRYAPWCMALTRSSSDDLSINVFPRDTRHEGGISP